MAELYGLLTPRGSIVGGLSSAAYNHDYNDLINKPSINSIPLKGNRSAADLGLVTPADIPVRTVNGLTGAVVLDGSNIKYDPSYTINQKIDDVAASIPVVNYPVTSVNTQTGSVVLDGDDIKYDSTYTVNQKIDNVEASIPVVSYPVTSVNTQTGAVVLDGTDIMYDSSYTVNQKIDARADKNPAKYGFTVSSSITNYNTGSFAIGNLMCVQQEFRVNTAIPAGDIIVTLPSDKKPATDTWGTLLNTNGTIAIQFKTDGTVRSGNNVPAQQFVLFGYYKIA